MYGKAFGRVILLSCLIGLAGCAGENPDPEPPQETVEWENLVVAVQSGDTGTVGDYFRKYQQLQEVIDHHGWYLIHHAAAAGNTEMIEYLVQQGADINALTRYNETAWTIAEEHDVEPNVLAFIESLGGWEY